MTAISRQLQTLPAGSAAAPQPVHEPHICLHKKIRVETLYSVVKHLKMPAVTPRLRAHRPATPSAADFPVVSQVIFKLFHWFKHISRLQYNAHIWKKNEISFSSTSLSYSVPCFFVTSFLPMSGLQENFLVTRDKHTPEGQDQLALSSQLTQGRLEMGPSRHRAKSIF